MHVQAARLLAFFTANRSADAERAADLAQHEGFLDASAVVRNKDGVAEDGAKLPKRAPKSRAAPKEKKGGNGEKKKVCAILIVESVCSV